jgi:hypothetical protein
MTQTNVLGFSLEEARGALRQYCFHLPAIDLLVRPHFGTFPARVRDISRIGIGLVCLLAIEPGTQVLFRMEPEGRLVSAHVVHSTWVRDGWQVGCAFAEPLTDEEVAAYVTSDTDLE